MRVCKKCFPKGSYPKQKEAGFYMDDVLKEQLDVLIKNIIKDWDFTIIISGGGEVRLGKSVLAMQIACYLAYQMREVHKIRIPFGLNNFIFDGKKLIEKGNELGTKNPYSPLLFDEAGADLTARKMMHTSTGDVLDYFRECGQYNLFNILVIPDYFDLPKSIAITRSIFLIDVYYISDKEGNFLRGYFNFYSRRQKKYLYLKGKKELNYMAVKYNFHGGFYNVYTVDEKGYRRAKQEALKHRTSRQRNKLILQRNAAFYLLHKDFDMKLEELGKRIEDLTGVYTPKQTISDSIGGISLENG